MASLIARADMVTFLSENGSVGSDKHRAKWLVSCLQSFGCQFYAAV
jgi:hypothetical protein